MQKVKTCLAAPSGSPVCLGLAKSVVFCPKFTLNSPGWLLRNTDAPAPSSRYSDRSTNTPGIKGLSRNVRDPPSPSGRFLFTKHCTIPALANLLHTLMAARRPTPHFPYRFPTSVVLHRPLLRISSLHFPSNSATVNNLFFAQMLASRSGSSLGQYPSLMKTWRHVDFLLTFLCIQSHANRYAIRLRIELLA